LIEPLGATARTLHDVHFRFILKIRGVCSCLETDLRPEVIAALGYGIWREQFRPVPFGAAPFSAIVCVLLELASKIGKICSGTSRRVSRRTTRRRIWFDFWTPLICSGKSDQPLFFESL